VICSREDCGKEFNQKTHNQKYCSDECCRIATNRRIMEKYYEKKAIIIILIYAVCVKKKGILRVKNICWR